MTPKETNQATKNMFLLINFKDMTILIQILKNWGL